MNKKLNVLVVFDDSRHLAADEDYDTFLKSPERKAEQHVYEALRNLGHHVRLLALTSEVGVLLDEVNQHRPDIVFNQVEQFNGDAFQERHVMGLLEMLQIPYTGTGTAGLMLSKNKGLAKKILAHHRIKTPTFAVIHRGSRVSPSKKLKYPIIVKPLREEASYGISMNSLVEDDKSFIERVRFVHESMGQGAIAEEYVDGRELYVGILGNHRLQVFPPREMIFTEVPDEEPKIATFKAKWDEKYRKRWGIKNCFANHLSETLLKKIEGVGKKIYNYLYLLGYARLDLRLTPQNEVVFLEANPNPFIAKDEDFALSAAKAGIEYEDLIQRILNYGLRH